MYCTLLNGSNGLKSNVKIFHNIVDNIFASVSQGIQIKAVLVIAMAPALV